MNKEERIAIHGAGRKYWKRLLSDVRGSYWLYLMMIPGFIYFVVFKYLPMWGVLIAFENYSPFAGIAGSEWVGAQWFEYFFSNKMWTRYLTNTLLLSFMNLAMFFPAPIILALMLNEMRHLRYKKLVQTFLYVPHFISIVIVVSITYVIFGSDGIIYKLTESLTGHSVKYLSDPGIFRWMIIGQTIWKETGWGTIIFLAALTNVDTELYEAAMVDGANRWHRLWHITLPAIRSTIVLMLVLRMGNVLDTGHEHLILMSNALNRSVSETLDVFVYNQGITAGQFSYTTAIGLMKSVVSIVLIITSNKIAHALGESGLY